MAMFNKIIKIKVPQPYMLDELYALFQEKGNFGLPVELVGKGPMRRIELVLDKDNAVWVGGGKKKIEMQVQKRNAGMDILKSVATDGWSDVLDRSGKIHHEAMLKAADEVRRLTGGV
ncbi:MAG: hypothetical protein GXY32_01550 [Ruminococcaceae bacterium]|nr:hypothetical protein [Oscillospiraceae bacterium]